MEDKTGKYTVTQDTHSCVHVHTCFTSTTLDCSPFDLSERALFTDKVIHHNPPLPGLPVHTLPILNHNRTDHNTKPMEHWCIATVAWTSCYCMTSSLCWQIAHNWLMVLITLYTYHFLCFLWLNLPSLISAMFG